uniref:RNA-directed DNA polymerase n=1 Tax=Trichuris muris TaxID=70415 RepID=A0A5S6Q5I1_TRIMR
MLRCCRRKRQHWQCNREIAILRRFPPDGRTISCCQRDIVIVAAVSHIWRIRPAALRDVLAAANATKLDTSLKWCRSAEATAHDDVITSISTVCATDIRRLYAPIEVNVSGQAGTVRCMLDTGSTVSILPKCVLREQFPRAQVQTATKRLTTYTESPLPTLGCLLATVSYKGRMANACFFIVGSGIPLIGMDLISALRITIKGTEIVAAIGPERPSLKRLTSIKQFVHKVKVRPNVKPVQQKLRRLPLSIKNAVSEELRRLMEEEIIERVNASQWISPIVVVQKKTGGIRLCVDLREPNKAVIADSFPLPHIDDLLLRFRGAALFSILDLKEAYHQLRLHEDSRDLTAFITHDGLFRFRRVPYGLSSAPSAFLKIMTEILQGLPGVVCYLDDLVVFGQSTYEHDRNLDAVIHRLQQYDVTLNSSKCKLRQTELLFLGYKITRAGIRPEKSHLTAISEMHEPTNVHELRSLLGLLSWYSKFIPNFSTLAEPLRALTHAGNTFTWSAEAQESVEKLKTLLLESSALSLFDPALPTTVTTDASDVGIGAVLTQKHSCGTENTVAFASRTLSSTERKYSIVEKEALACVWAVEKWRPWLWGIPFELCSDQQALTTLLTSKAADRARMRIARWSARQLPFTYTVRHKPGTLNVVADTLSRLPIQSTDTEGNDDDEMVAEISNELIGIKQDDIRTATRHCSVLQKVTNYIQNGWPTNAKRIEEQLTPFFRLRFVIPESLQARLVALAHENHQGIVRTKMRLRELYWWPGMDNQVET